MTGWLDEGLKHLWFPYTQMKMALPPLPVVRTEGVRLHLADGRTLIDGVASWWTAAHGYNHPHIISAIKAQAEVMPHVMLGGLVHESASRLASRLGALAPGDLGRVFFAESGSVAVEVALKMAVQFWRNRGEAGRNRFLSFYGGYHGDTAMAMAVTDPEVGMHALFKGYVPEQLFAHLPTGAAREQEFDRLLEKHHRSLAGVIVEPLVQGAGGMRFHAPEVLEKIRAACDRHDLLLIADEIFTGFARTGTLFACEQAAIVPDILTLSKALTGGVLPLSCAIARPRVFDAFFDDDPAKALMHGPTFMANALGCAAANASLDLFEKEPRLQQVAAIARQMESELQACRKIGGVKDVRVKGAIGVVELRQINNLDALRAAFVKEGVWIRPFGNTVYLTPPLVIESADLSCLTGAIGKVLSRP
jgi:adenosylmethionine---8-amino-7-oxononanoate aminotransferase